MSKHTFTFHHHDFGDDAESVWVAAWVDEIDGRGIGAYVGRNGEVSLGDNIDWRVQDDLEDMGLDPDSADALSLLAEWAEAAADEGRRLFEERDAGPVPRRRA